MRVHSDPGDGRTEAERFGFAAPLGQRQRKTAVQGIAGAESIHRADRKHRYAVERTAVEGQGYRLARR